MYPKFRTTPSCQGTNTEMWFIEGLRGSYQNEVMLKRICKGCPVQDQCLDYALKNAVIGYWAGTTEQIRKRIRKRKNIIFRGYFPHAEGKIDVYANLSRKLKLFGSNYLYI